MNNKPLSVFDFVLAEGCDDYVSLRLIVDHAYHTLGIEDSQKRRHKVITAIQDLLRADLVTAGDLFKTGFQRWSGSPNEIVSRIEEEWAKLGADPAIGTEIVWFENSVEGDRLAGRN